jgi:hypothetical protein
VLASAAGYTAFGFPPFPVFSARSRLRRVRSPCRLFRRLGRPAEKRGFAKTVWIGSTPTSTFHPSLRAVHFPTAAELSAQTRMIAIVGAG